MIKYSSVLFIFIFSCFFGFSTTSKANLLGNFKVSQNATKVDQRRTVSSGSRSQCSQRVPTKSISLLVPKTKVAHQTFLSRPPLYLYTQISKPLNLEFTLVNPRRPKPLVHQIIAVNHQRIVKIQIPLEIQLQENTIYIWNIAIPCQNDLESYQTVLSAGIERITKPSNLAAQISSKKSNIEKIQIFAQNGIWYEALELAVNYDQKIGSKNYLPALLMSAGIE